MKNAISVRTLRITQDGDTPLFCFCLRARDILRVADISRIGKSSGGELLGTKGARWAGTSLRL